MVSTTVRPDNILDKFELSRILLDKGNKFSKTADKLYFCGILD